MVPQFSPGDHVDEYQRRRDHSRVDDNTVTTRTAIKQSGTTFNDVPSNHGIYSFARTQAKNRYFVRMTAKEQLKQTVEGLSEAEAQDALGFIVRRQSERDALAELLDRAPIDDEPTTSEEDEGVREAGEQIIRGEVLSADEIRREVA